RCGWRRVDVRTYGSVSVCATCLRMAVRDWFRRSRRRGEALACPDKLRLLVEYQKSVQAHTATISDLVIEILSLEQWNRLKAAADSARDASNEARDRFERHIAEHGC